MAGMQEKASKWLHDNRKQLKQIIDQRKSQHQKSPNPEKKSDVNNCSYCPKVFLDAEFLVKHVLRRHSDKLVLMHKKHLDSTNSENTCHPSSDVMKFIKAEFADLKVEMKEMKQVVSELALTNSCSQEENPLTIVPSDVMNSHIHVKSDSTPDCTILTECSPKNSVKLFDVIPPNLETQVHDLFEKYKKDVIIKEVNAVVTLNKEVLFEELSNCLQTELQNLLLYHLNKKSAEWNKDISKLQNEVLRLTELVTLNTKKIESPEALQKLEKKFEQQLHIFLNSSLYHDKRLSHVKQKNIKSHKSENHSKRKKKSLYTSNSQDLHQTQETSLLHHQSKISLSDSNERKHRQANNMKPIVRKEKSKEPYENEIIYIINEKLRALNIDPHSQKLSPHEFEKKMHLFKSEREIQSSSVVQFSEMLKEIDTYVEDLTNSKLKAKRPKKLRFFDYHPQCCTPIREKGLKAISNVPKPAIEKEALSQMSPVELAGDHYAQGDCHVVIKEVSEMVNMLSVPNVEKHPLEPLNDELIEVGLKCDMSSMQSSDLCATETYGNKPPESVKSVSFKDSSRNFSDSSQNIENLSELSSLSDLED